VDVSLWGGWHVTVFHPWVWFTLVLLVLIVGALLAKRVLIR